jgi:hypothetical protein
LTIFPDPTTSIYSVVKLGTKAASICFNWLILLLYLMKRDSSMHGRNSSSQF